MTPPTNPPNVSEVSKEAREAAYKCAQDIRDAGPRHEAWPGWNLNTAAAIIDRARAEDKRRIAELEGTLKPFAELLKRAGIEAEHKDNDEFMSAENLIGRFTILTVGDIRRAATALNHTP